MSDFLGAIQSLFHALEPKYFLFSVAVLVFALLLTVLHAQFKKDKNKMRIWRILCFLPLVISIIHFILFFAGTPLCTEIVLFYIPSVFIALWTLFGDKKKLYVIFTAAVYLINAVGFVSIPSLGFRGNFVRMSYTESFKATVSEMRDNYVLTEWKKIDFDAIEAELLPLVEEAEKNNDPAAFSAALAEYRSKFHDGHVEMFILDSNVKKNFIDRFTGNDYGLSMITIDDGRTIAVMTDEDSDVRTAGIHDGTVITKWNGVAIDEAKKGAEYTGVRNIPVASNEELMKAAFLAGSGGESVNVTFINDKGKEETVSLDKIGSYYGRYTAMTDKLFSKDKTKDENYSYRMLNDKCGYILIKNESFNGYDDIAWLTGNHPAVRKDFIERLDDLKSQGMETLVIDMRNNTGGYDVVALGWASAFADKQYYAYSLGMKTDSGYESTANQYLYPSGEYADMKVVVLVNMFCNSAGDTAMLSLSKLPNVTVLGITDPNGSAQNTGGSCYLSGGIAAINYPVEPVLDESGNPHIDVSDARISRNPVDEYIPLDYNAATRIFCNGEDYELDYAINYLSAK